MEGSISVRLSPTPLKSSLFPTNIAPQNAERPTSPSLGFMLAHQEIMEMREKKSASRESNPRPSDAKAERKKKSKSKKSRNLKICFLSFFNMSWAYSNAFNCTSSFENTPMTKRPKTMIFADFGGENPVI